MIPFDPLDAATARPATARAATASGATDASRPATGGSLPIGAPARQVPLEEDVAYTGWAALTVRVAWALLANGIRLHPDVLRAARDHALFHIHPSTPLPHAEDRVDHLVAQLVRRARREVDRDRWPQDLEMPLSPRWRSAIERAANDEAAVNLLHHHYADRRPIEQIAMHLGVDRIVLESTRGGLHEVVRACAAADGMSLHDWPAERIDRLLARLATFKPEPCPPAEEVVSGGHPEHRASCIRCDRLIRLIKAGGLAWEDVLPPALGARPTATVSVLVVQLHPDARGHRPPLLEALTCRRVPVSDDLIVIDASDLSAPRMAVELACLVGAPERHHLRGMVVTGPGRWSRNGLLGPLVHQAETELRCRPWGRVEGLPDLPEPEPPPPSPRRAWTAVAGLAAITALLAVWALVPSAAPPTRLDADFSPGRSGVWASLDVDEATIVNVVRERGGQLDVALVGDDPVDKLAIATGDGAYRIHAQGDGVLVIASPAPIPSLQTVVARSARLEDVAAHVTASQPTGATRIYRR